MASKIYWKYGDTKTDLVLQLVDADGSYPDLSAVSSVTVKLKKAGESTISLTGAVHDSATGKVRWRPTADQSDYGTTAGKVDTGRYDLQVYVAHSDGREQTFPTQGNAELVVEAQL